MAAALALAAILRVARPSNNPDSGHVITRNAGRALIRLGFNFTAIDAHGLPHPRPFCPPRRFWCSMTKATRPPPRRTRLRPSS